MQNIQKYFVILENLQYEDTTSADNNLEANLKILAKYLKNENLNIAPYTNELTTDDTSSNSWKCSCYLFYLLLTIKNNINLDSTNREDLISVRHLNDFLKTIKLASRYGIVYNLPPYLQQHQIFNCKNTATNNRSCLRAGILVLNELFTVVTIASSRSLDEVVLEIMAGIYTADDQSLQPILTRLWEHTSKENYFRYLLILKSIATLPSGIQINLHHELLSRLTEPDGFRLLILNTVPSAIGTAEIPNWKRYEVVARIIARKGHRFQFYEKMIEQIFDFIENSYFDAIEKSLVPAGIVTLRKLCLLGDTIQGNIQFRIDAMYIPFQAPQDVIAGLVLMDSDEFQNFVRLQCVYFNGSSFEALPSSFLVKYLPLLIGLFGILEECKVEKELTALISQSLTNRSNAELKDVLEAVFKRNVENFVYLHERIGVRKMDSTGSFSIQIMPQDFQNPSDLPSNLVKILKSSNNNILLYNCFIQILTILEEIEPEMGANSTDIDLIRSEDELEEFLSRKFQTRFAVIAALTELTSFRQFHSQFQENPDGILDFLQKILQRRIQANCGTIDDENLSIILAVFQEFIETANDYERYRPVKNALKTYLNQVKIEQLKHQIQMIISTIECGPSSSTPGTSNYDLARSLLAESQAHLRVYGISQLIKLLNDRDEAALSNKHQIMAMALHALRDEESYTYLNCVRLFVCLMKFMQSEVLETLSAEYLNENENIEFRLKLGEAVLKVTEELGPLSYNYKDILINCFLHGSRSKINEFRASSFSNLSTICRLLSYQVHNFFQELMNLIEATIQTETYLPARRACVLVLSQLLWGIDNLTEFENTLLPIYRLLSQIVDNDSDEKTRIHATNGLNYLKDKCKAFLFPERKLEKNIRIFGIKDDPGEKKSSGHILEL